MRMWLINPQWMCRQHLLGEHNEIHMLAGSIAKNHNLEGYIKNGLIDLGRLQSRHDKLASEMVARGYNHQSPLKIEVSKDHKYYEAINNQNPMNTVDREAAINDLMERCAECWERVANMNPHTNWI